MGNNEFDVNIVATLSSLQSTVEGQTDGVFSAEVSTTTPDISSNIVFSLSRPPTAELSAETESIDSDFNGWFGRGVKDIYVEGSYLCFEMSDGQVYAFDKELIGKDGKSAYEYAVEAGYQGTEEEFARDLGRQVDTYSRTEINEFLSGKVDKEVGKSLISDEELERLSHVFNYDDSELRAEIAEKADLDDVVTGVKGSQETEYRKGNVELTPQNLLLNGEVDAIENLGKASFSEITFDHWEAR